MVLSESGDVALTHVLDHFEEVSFDAELGGFTRGIGDTQGAAGTTLGLAAGEVVTALVRVSLTVGFGLKQFVGEHAVAPATIVVQQCQRTDGLVEDVEVASVQKQTLGSDQSFAGHLEGGGLCRIARVSRTGVLLKSHQDLVLHDVACRCATQSLICGALTRLLGSGLAPEAIQVVIPKALYPLALILSHRISSDYLISITLFRARGSNTVFPLET